MSTIAIAPAPYGRVRHGRKSGARASRPVQRSGAVRLTRRGRLLVLLLGLALGLGAALWLAAGSVASDDAGVVQVEVVTVDHGETLWGIAAAAADDGEVPAMMQRIRELNAFEGNVLQAGQELRVPLD